MIKNNITSELKERFKNAIETTIKTGKEQGFYICKDKDSKLFAEKSCEGGECGLDIGHPRDACKGNINQGDFHTHPYMSLQPNERYVLIKIYGHDRVVKDLRNVIIQEFQAIHNKEGIKNASINTPSYIDALKAARYKCKNLTQGTVCVGSDIERDSVDCWTVKQTDKETMDRNCKKMEKEWEATRMTRKGGGAPIKKWILPLFEKETINLKKI